ncbi:hypothetical protein [Streptomyces sp. NPDC012510]|uniref:hypothetical protein n=1 Tax=Streptomyces sp. NPDC012510 TaxID=3364838 RepID=UPI0036EB7FE2
MEIWETRGPDAGRPYDANFKRLADEIRPGGDGYYTYTVKPRSIVTLTTLDKRHDKATKQRLTESWDRPVVGLRDHARNPAGPLATLDIR